LLRGIIAEPCNDQGFECISTNIWIVLRVIWEHIILVKLRVKKTHMPRSRTSVKKIITERVALTELWAVLQQLLLAFLLLLLDTKLSLQPTLRGLIFIGALVLFELREKCSDARDGCCPSVFRRVVRGRKESKTWARGE
jgi:L-asparagine transporter-like permease